MLLVEAKLTEIGCYKMTQVMYKFFRFIEIDIQYLRVPLPFRRKILNITRTNIRLILNLVLKPQKYKPVKIDNNSIFYDTPFATKTLLTTIYDFYLETKLATILPKRPVVVDIGANIGQFVIATKSFYPQAKIYSVEPAEDVFKILRKNTENLNNVSVFNYGLSNRNGKASFYQNKNFSEWSGLHRLEGYEYEKKTIEIRKGDELFKKIPIIDLLKIDVEGAELEVLHGLQETLKRSKYILIEASILRNSHDIGSKNMLALLFRSNFTINHIGRIFSDNKGQYQGAIDILLKNTLFE